MGRGACSIARLHVASITSANSKLLTAKCVKLREQVRGRAHNASNNLANCEGRPKPSVAPRDLRVLDSRHSTLVSVVAVVVCHIRRIVSTQYPSKSRTPLVPSSKSFQLAKFLIRVRRVVNLFQSLIRRDGGGRKTIAGICSRVEATLLRLGLQSVEYV